MIRVPGRKCGYFTIRRGQGRGKRGAKVKPGLQIEFPRGIIVGWGHKSTFKALEIKPCIDIISLKIY